MRRRNAWGDSPVKPSDTDVQPMMGGRRKTMGRKGGQPPGLGLSIKKPAAQVAEEDYLSNQNRKNAEWRAQRQRLINRLAELKPSSTKKPARNILSEVNVAKYNNSNNNEYEENVIEVNLNADPNTWNFSAKPRLPKNIRVVQPNMSRKRNRHVAVLNSHKNATKMKKARPANTRRASNRR